MTRVITIKPDQLGAAYLKEHKHVLKSYDQAARAAAHRLKAHLVQVVDEMGITDRGTYKNGFKVVNKSVLNDAPHAGIIELGARPHFLSTEAINALAGWVRRKLQIADHREALSIAYAIAHKISVEGQKPKYVMQNAVPMAKVFFSEELLRILARDH